MAGQPGVQVRVTISYHGDQEASIDLRRELRTGDPAKIDVYMLGFLTLWVMHDLAEIDGHATGQALSEVLAWLAGALPALARGENLIPIRVVRPKWRPGPKSVVFEFSIQDDGRVTHGYRTQGFGDDDPRSNFYLTNAYVMLVQRLAQERPTDQAFLRQVGLVLQGCALVDAQKLREEDINEIGTAIWRMTAGQVAR